MIRCPDLTNYSSTPVLEVFCLSSCKDLINSPLICTDPLVFHVFAFQKRGVFTNAASVYRRVGQVDISYRVNVMKYLQLGQTQNRLNFDFSYQIKAFKSKRNILWFFKV